jgi:hypothetical protein
MGKSSTAASTERRAIEVVGCDITLEVTKAAAIKVGPKFIHFDQLPDGSWRILYNAEMIPDFTKVEAFKIIREKRNEY